MSRYSLKKSAHDEGASKEKIPQGFYEFAITDYKEKNKDGEWLETKNGDPKIMIICEVVNSKEDNGKSCVHNIIFYKPDSPGIKGIGITRHFLNVIGEPYQGDLDADPESWIGKRFKAEVIHNGEYVNLTNIESCSDDLFSEPVVGTPKTGNPGEITDVNDIVWEE